VNSDPREISTSFEGKDQDPRETPKPLKFIEMNKRKFLVKVLFAML